MEDQEQKEKINFICVRSAYIPQTNDLNSFYNKFNPWGDLKN